MTTKKLTLAAALVASMIALASVPASAADAVFRYDGGTIAYTSTTAVAAGDVVVLRTQVCAVAKQAIAAGDLGSVYVLGTFDFAKQVDQSWAMGQAVYWDADANAYGLATGTGAVTPTPADGVWVGYAVENCVTNDPVVRVMLCPPSNMDAGSLAVPLNATVGGTLAVIGAISGSSTVGATGFKIGAVSGWSGAVTNISTLATNIEYFSGGVVTNVTRNP